MTVRDELNDLKFRLRLKTDEELAVVLNTSKASIDRWISRKEIPKKWRRIIDMQFNGLNVSNGHFINGNNVSVGNYHIGQNTASRSDAELINALKENDPNREYRDLEDLKKRLFIKTNDEFMKIFQLTREELKKIPASGIPQKMAAAAHAIERIIYGILLDPGEATGLNEYGRIKIEGGTRELVGDDIKIAYLLAYANKEFKQNVLKKLEAFRELSKI